jgi:gamma-glutamyltranspeptidase/glutathione hydrolase
MNPIRHSTPLMTRSELKSSGGMVVAGDGREAHAGAEILAAGGTATDALVAAAFVAAVVEPSMTGVGGSGHLSVFRSDTREFFAVDHNIRAPSAAHSNFFELDRDRPGSYLGFPGTVDDQNAYGPKSVGVPGSVAGLCAAHERWGRLPLATVMRAALELAEEGIPITWREQLDISGNLDRLPQFPALADAIAPGRAPLRARDSFDSGGHLRLPGLVDTLHRIATDGAPGFYRGPTATAIAATMAELGGVITEADLASYTPKVMLETPAMFGGFAYTTSNEPSAYEILNLLASLGFERTTPGSADYFHLVAEAMAHAYADSFEFYGDPEAVHSPTRGLASAGYADVRANAIAANAAAARPVTAGDPWPFEPAADRASAAAGPSVGGVGGTTHMVAVDSYGNLAALCTTLETLFGSLVLVPGTGVILNNSMLDFDPRPGRPNSVAANKMPLFGVPVVVAAKDGLPAFAAAGAGGYRITSSVLHTFINYAMFGMGAQAAADMPRTFSQGGDTYLHANVSAQIRDQLAARGHKVVSEEDGARSPAFGRVGAVGFDPETGEFASGSQPALVTAAAAV